MAIKYVVNVSGADGDDPIISTQKRENLLAIARQLRAVASGHKPVIYNIDVRDAAVLATGTVTLSGGSGTITATINGVAIAITWATSDTNSAALLAAAINASTDALVQNIVTATSAAGVVTVSAVVPGVVGNCVTLAASGTGATASGARLTGGTETRVNMSF
jgi:phage tail sheath gpL-like